MTISPIDNSYLFNPIINIETFSTSSSLDVPVPATKSEEEEFGSPVNLNDYYENLSNSNLISDIGTNVKASADALDHAMVSALQNGMNVQDAVNINCALHAYKANCHVAKSTFELKI